MKREQDDVANALAAGQQHDGPIDSNSQTTGGWHSVLEREHEILVHDGHRFFLALELYAEVLFLDGGVVQLRVCIAEFHSAGAAEEARREFERVFSLRNLPQEIPEVVVDPPGDTMLLSKLLVAAGLSTSNSEARRLIEQGGVKVDGEASREIKTELPTTNDEPLLVQVGKRRFARVSFTRD